MNALRVETCMLYMYFKETSLISHASLESWNKESINQSITTICVTKSRSWRQPLRVEAGTTSLESKFEKLAYQV